MAEIEIIITAFQAASTDIFFPLLLLLAGVGIFFGLSYVRRIPKNWARNFEHVAIGLGVLSMPLIWLFGIRFFYVFLIGQIIPPY